MVSPFHASARGQEASMAHTIKSSRTISAQSWECEPPLPGGIVVAVDGSPESLAALNTASTIAKRSRCLAHVVSVLPLDTAHQIRLRVGSSRDNVDNVRLQLWDAVVRDLMKAANLGEGWSHQAVLGRPAGVIVSVAEARGADLIVMGRREHGMMDRILGGETTLQVIRLSPIPVLGVQSDLEGPRSIAAAVDFSPPSARAAQVALEMLGGSGTLYLVHVEPPVELFQQASTVPDDMRYPGDIVTWFRRLVHSLHAPEGVIVEPVVLNGKPVPTLIEFAERVGAGMIASGSYGHTRMERFLLGSVSTGLVRNARCPVLVSPPGD